MTISDSELNRQVSREVARIQSENERPVSRRGQPCRVCVNEDARNRVNRLLSVGMGPTEIVRNLEDINVRLPKKRQIGFWSVREHRERHFNLQEPQKAALVRILEAEYQREHTDMLAEGIENFLTARGYLKIVAKKGLENLLQESTEVDFETGLEAQLKLEQIEKADRDQAERAAMRRDLGLIQQAIRETLTDDQMRALSHRLDVLRGVASDDDDEDAIEGEVVGDDDDDEYPDEVADFTMDKDDADELGD
ncbi:hypothetical protein SEA_SCOOBYDOOBYDOO_202 [Mycobacterium phage ScoobyDoobyDoo]|nr:hypothetical protein SEA_SCOOBYDOOBYDOO_202 [Mycobacterium phage ScoobyDoobyDoo]